MYKYIIYGMKVESDIVLEGLTEEKENGASDITICEGVNDPKLLNLSKEIPEIKCDFLYNANDLYAWVYKPDILVAQIENGNTIRYKLIGGLDLEGAKQLIVFICLIIACAQRNMIFMHGSCIRLNEKAFIIGGESGAGKSTFTTELINNNEMYLSDDVCAIKFKENEPFVQSSLPERKLCKDAALRYGYDVTKLKKLDDLSVEKYIIEQVEQFYQEETVLGGIIIITPSDSKDVALEELSEQQKIEVVIEDVLYRNLYVRIGNVKEMHEQLMKIVKDVPMYRFWRPTNRDTGAEMLELFRQYFATQDNLA